MKPIVLGYWADWHPALPPEKIDFSLYTHLCHAFTLVTEAGLLRPLDDEAATTGLIRRAKSKSVPVLLSLGGGSNSALISRVINTPARVEALATAVALQVKRLGYSGIDLDWEGIQTQEQQSSLEALVFALRKRLPRPYLLTQAVGGSHWANDFVSPKRLLPHIDFLNVMTYDFSGPWSETSGHNAPMSFCKSAVEFWHGKLGWPKSQLNLGIPLYGRGFKANSPGEKVKGEYKHSYVSYNEVQELLKSGWEKRVETKESVPYLYKPGGGEIIGYEDAESAHKKGLWAREQKLGGIFFWEIAEDFDGKTNPLVRAARDGLTGR